ncbi:MAG: family 78 glycoside hydrolase catalytic domain [Bacteroides sp.]|nr:family 78 glycoside hydrolase catalytic domain [Bacteroides sp.]
MKQNILNKIGLTCLLVTSLFISCQKNQGTLFPDSLVCEYLINPQAVDSPHPRLEWVDRPTKVEARGLYRTAYQIEAASSREKLLEGKADLWNTGKVEDSASLRIAYKGRTLSAGETCWWRVRIWDQNGKPSAWSEPANWVTGLPEKEWKAQWIGVPWQDDTALDELEDKTPPPAPLLRKTFRVKEGLQSARVWISGLGYYELSLNGQKIGDEVLVPNQTNYDHRSGLLERTVPVEDNFTEYKVMYLSYDLTDRLQEGENALGVILGNGFYNADQHWVKGYGSPRLLLQMHLTYKDGTQDIIVSNPSWKVSKSAIVSDMIYQGEHYDARLEQEGWDTANFDDSQWEQAVLRKKPFGRLMAQNGPSDRVMEKLQPKKIEALGDGRYRIDFGEEISGWVHLQDVEGPAGQRIDIRYICESKMGTNSYTLKGKGKENYATRFTWYVFREVEISGWPGELKESQVIAEAVYSDVKQTASFDCDNDLINTIHRIWRRSETDNMHGSIQSDCPHRERSAYTGDGQIVCNMVMETYDVRAFYNKWLDDMRGAQNPESGYVPNGAPWQPGCGGGPAWGAAINIMPWSFYWHYGDKEMLEQYYPHMVAQLSFMRQAVDKEGIMEMKDPCQWKNLGDWVAPGPLPNAAMVHTYFYWLCNKLTSYAAEALGKKDEAQQLEAEAERARQGFMKRFWDEKEQSYGPYGGNIFALSMGVDADRLELVRQALRKVIEVNNNHLDTGIYGTRLLFETLAHHDMVDLAYQIINQRTEPSFGWWIEQGATTTWEQWDGNNSRNHPMFGGSLVWLQRCLAGIQLVECAPAYSQIVIKPIIPEGLNRASYQIETVRGLVSNSWKRNEKCFEMTTIVPVGSTAKVYLPWKEGTKWLESGSSLKDTEYLKVLGKEDGFLCIQLTSGTYKFMSQAL